jgi:hypothetical protein
MPNGAGLTPWRYLLAGTAVLAILTIPFFSMQLGHDATVGN